MSCIGHLINYVIQNCFIWSVWLPRSVSLLIVNILIDKTYARDVMSVS